MFDRHATDNESQLPTLSSSRYVLERELGRGGMGAVYLARDVALNTRVAVKCPHASLLQDHEFAERFNNEIKSLVALRHPHIVSVQDVGTQARQPYVVLQYLGGGALDEQIDAETSPLTLVTALRQWLPAMADALDFMHSQGFIHRDVKPGNVLFDEHGHAYLGDFSIAKVSFAAQEGGGSRGLTRTGTVLGTPEYMAPELAMGEAYDHSVDQYALAVTVFEYLTGRTPYVGATPAAVLLNQSTQKIPLLHGLAPWLPPESSGVILAALSKDYRERHGTCRDFADAFLATIPHDVPDEPGLISFSSEAVVRLQCSACGEPVGVTDKHAGKRARCPACGVRLMVSDSLDTLRILDTQNDFQRGHTIALSRVSDTTTSGRRESSDTGIEGVTEATSAGNASRPGQVTSLALQLKLLWRTVSGRAILTSCIVTILAIWVVGAYWPDNTPEDLKIGQTAVTADELSEAASVSVQEEPSKNVNDPPLAASHPVSTEATADSGLASRDPETLPVVDASSDAPQTGTAADIDTAATSPASAKSDAVAANTEPNVSNETTTNTAFPSAFTNSIGMHFRLISAGDFMMGSTLSPEAASAADKFHPPVSAFYSEHPRHHVQFTASFYLGQHEVTVGQFRDFVLATGYKTEAETNGKGGFGWDLKAGGLSQDVTYTWKNPGFSQNDNHPVVNVTWNDAMAFCSWLSHEEGQEYRLPSEAEWEYACRAGTTTMYQHGDNSEGLVSIGNVADGSLTAECLQSKLKVRGELIAEDGYAFTAPVGEFPENAFGLCDMHGNVFEWCSDWASEDYYKESPATDPRGPSTGSRRVCRGGSWYGVVRYCRSANRMSHQSSFPSCNLGFRVLRIHGSSAMPSGDTPSAPPLDSIARTGTRAGEERDDNSLSMKLVWCPPGSFTIGSQDREDNGNLVTLTQGFWLGKYEVAQEEWHNVMGGEPWKKRFDFKEGNRIAATDVSWENAIIFCEKLTASERAAGRLPNDWEYTLPTEAQWEYACRAGTTTAYSFGDNPAQLGEYAWFRTNAYDAGERNAHEVGQKLPNGWNIHDIHGNVTEWCLDCYGESLPSGTDPRGPPSKSYRVLRGGDWSDYARDCQSAYRYGLFARRTLPTLGFRVLCGSVRSSMSTADTRDSQLPATIIGLGTRAGDERSENSLNMKMVWCPPGSFMMGSPVTEREREVTEDQVAVTLTQGFWLGKYEVTQREWRDVMATEPWKGQKRVMHGDEIAATYVKWDEAVAFCEKLTASEHAGGSLPNDWEYTLPTEAQWEYACRAGTTTVFSFGDSPDQLAKHGWYEANAYRAREGYAHEVGQKLPNDWNLHDMHGNVFEWCSDLYGLSLPGGTDPRGTDLRGPNPRGIDPRDRSSISYPVIRGGSWFNPVKLCRSAARTRHSPSSRSYHLGFRVALVRPRGVDTAEAVVQLAAPVPINKNFDQYSLVRDAESTFRLQWSPVDGAASYRIQVDRFLGPTRLRRAAWIRRETFQTNTTETQYGSTGGHRWRVAAITSENRLGQWSEWRLFYCHPPADIRDSPKYMSNFSRFAPEILDAPLTE